MNSQSSVEFLLISAALLSMAALSLGIYYHMLRVSSSAASSLMGAQNAIAVPAANVAAYQPTAALFLQQNATYGSEEYAYGYVYAGNYTVNMSLSSDGVAILGNSTYSVNGGSSIIQFGFIPENSGESSITLNYSYLYGGKPVSYSKSYYLLAMLKYSGASPNSSVQYSGKVTGLNYSLGYNTSASPVGKIYVSTHCTYTNFYGNPLPFSEQCGSASWDYRIFSNYCYYYSDTSTQTYCVYLDKVATAVYPEGQPKPAYSVNASVSLGSAHYSSIINSSSNSTVYSASGEPSGYAYNNGTVTYSPIQPDSVYLNLSNGTQKIVPQQYYYGYASAFSSLSGYMSYYNGTAVSQSELSSIGGKLSSYNESLAQLLSSAPLETSCYYSLKKSRYVCPYPGQFGFQSIAFHVDGISTSANITAGSSTIRLT